MKAIGLMTVQVLAVIGTNVAALWALIEFILYLAKDDKFNWMSVWLFIICCVIAIANAIITAIDTKKHNDSVMAGLKDRRASMKKSKWQERMEEMAEKRANTKD